MKKIFLSAALAGTSILYAGMMPGMDMMDNMPMMGKDKKSSSKMPGMDMVEDMMGKKDKGSSDMKMPGMDMMDDMPMMGKKDKGSSPMKMPEMPGMGSGADGIKMPDMPEMPDMPKMPKMPDVDSFKEGKMPEVPGMNGGKNSQFEIPGMDAMKDGGMPDMPNMDSMKEGKLPSMDKIQEKIPMMGSDNGMKMPEMPMKNSKQIGSKDTVGVKKMPTMDNMPFFGKDKDGKAEELPDMPAMDMMEDMMGGKGKDGGMKMPFFN